MTLTRRALPALLLIFAALPASGQQFEGRLYQSMRWRMIGPFRAGRTVGATGVPGRPNVFYIGVNNGGVWKTDDYGHTWAPVFDEQPTGSVGALAVAPSRPDTVYVGSGEGLQRPDLSVGDGLYKSTDGGRTWAHLGLRDGQQIGSIIVDPRDPDRLFVAVLGHPYGPNEERGVFRSADGGRTFEKVLYKDENTGAIALAFDPTTPRTVYAVLWAARQGPWENGAWQGPGSGLFKSTDGGTTWRQLTKGLPTFEQGLGRIGIAVAPGEPRRLYATVDAPQLGGIYRSDDGGESWRRVTDEARVWARGSDFAEIKVDPRDPDVVYTGSIAAYRSADGGKTFHAWKGAPGGDDYHTIWINPENPQIVLLATDQGATITVNGGRTWSSWHNQPTAQFYHVSTDNQFPYWVYGGQQESGSVGTTSRGDNGAITFRDWRTVGAEEYGYVAADPVNAVREDPVRKGLLFAGTERAVHVSFNDGDDWQPLRLNMPATSIRDLVVHRDDLVVGTHGRSFWILDDITPLRQIDATVAAADAFLFAPQTAYRVRRNVNTDTPLPPEEPAGQNPPDGAVINYYLKTDSTAPVVLEIFDRGGRLVRRFRSDDRPEFVDEKELPHATYWVRPPRTLPASSGMQRFVWDLHHPPPRALRRAFPISAIYRDTPRHPLGPSVLPGEYTVKLTAGGKTHLRTLRVEMDPRVKTPRAGLERQFTLSAQAAGGMTETFDALAGLKQIRARINDLRKRAATLPPAVNEALTALDRKAAALEGGAGATTPDFNQLHTQLATLYGVLQQADAAPTTQAAAAAADLPRRLREALSAWAELKTKDVESVNAQLRAAGLPAL